MTTGHRSTASAWARAPGRGIIGLAMLALLALGAWSFGRPVAAQTLCGARGEVLARLADRYPGLPLPLGFSQDGGRLEVLTSPDGGWTILVTFPDRPTCMVASGKAWESRGAVGQPA
jgi:hypothetical protein